MSCISAPSRAKRMETAEQTEASQIPFFSRFTFVTNLLRTMTDVCEAFCFFRVFSGLITNIRVHSCPFVVPLKQRQLVRIVLWLFLFRQRQLRHAFHV